MITGIACDDKVTVLLKAQLLRETALISIQLNFNLLRIFNVNRSFFSGISDVKTPMLIMNFVDSYSSDVSFSGCCVVTRELRNRSSR